MIFVGIAENTKGYRVFDEQTLKVITVRSIMSKNKDEAERFIPIGEKCQIEHTNDGFQDIQPEEERMDWQDITCMISSMDEDIPKNYDDVMKSRNKENWCNAMNDEIRSLLENNTWTLVCVL